MNSILDASRASADMLLDELRAAGAVVKTPKEIRCPFHDDKHPSAGIYEENGVWRFKCHGGSCGFNGDVFDVRARAQSLPLKDVLPKSDSVHSNARQFFEKPKAKPVYSLEKIKAMLADRLEAFYAYQNPATKAIDMAVFRYVEDGKKKFWQARPDGDGFVLEGPPKPWPIYNRSRLASAEQVVVVEGEKCVHALHDVGIVATTSPGGAGKAGYADWSLLAGKTAILWPDADESGMKHMREVAEILSQLDPPAKVRWMDPAQLGLSGKEDVVDYLASLADMGKEAQRLAVLAAMQDSEGSSPGDLVAQRIMDIASGKLREVDWPWKNVTDLTVSLLPGTVTILCGDPGDGKSLLVLQAYTAWEMAGEKPAIFNLEEDNTYHLQRALAQLSGNSEITRYRWIKDNLDEATRIAAEHKNTIDRLGARMRQAPDNQVSLDNIAEWVEAKCADGCGVIIVDPITAAAASREPWIDDLKFLMRVKTAVRKHDTRLILVTHPRKGRKNSISMEDLAGGYAYAKFTQSVFWMEKHEPPEEHRTWNNGLCLLTEYNRTMHICKCRNGRGPGKRIAFNFDHQTLRFEERGVIVKD